MKYFWHMVSYRSKRGVKQDPERWEGCKVESSEEEKYNPTCAWLSLRPHKLSSIFAEALPAPKSSLTDWPRKASCKWPMRACTYNTAPTTTHKATGGDKQWRRALVDLDSARNLSHIFDSPCTCSITVCSISSHYLRQTLCRLRSWTPLPTKPDRR